MGNRVKPTLIQNHGAAVGDDLFGVENENLGPAVAAGLGSGVAARGAIARVGRNGTAEHVTRMPGQIEVDPCGCHAAAAWVPEGAGQELGRKKLIIVPERWPCLLRK